MTGKEEKKAYVLDTNVAMNDPNCFFNFEEHDVVITLDILRELENNRKGSDEVNRNARQALRTIDEMVEEARTTGKLPGQGIPLGEGMGNFYIYSPERGTDGSVSKDLDLSRVDDRNIALTKKINRGELHKHRGGAVLVTDDIPVKIRSHSLEIPAESYRTHAVDVEQIEDKVKIKELHVSGDRINALFEDDYIEVIEEDQERNFRDIANLFYKLIDYENSSHSALVRYDKKKGAFRKVYQERGVYKLHPKNAEQSCLLDLLFDPSIEIVTVAGPAGTGKTVLTLGAGLEQVIRERAYESVEISKPYKSATGEELGFLPGEYEEKVAPWMQSFEDALRSLNPSRAFNQPGLSLEYFMSTAPLTDVEPHEYKKEKSKYPTGSGRLNIVKPEFIRGRNIPDAFIFVDEAQNWTPSVVRTVMTRPGQGSKIVLAGDPSQIDDRFIRRSSNGLVYAMERLLGKQTSRGDYNTGAIMMKPTGVVRSSVAEMAVKYL